MRTKKWFHCITCLSLAFILGLFLSGYAAPQQQTQSADQKKVQTANPQKAATPDRPKVKPSDLQKVKAKENTLTDYYKKWLNEDVTYIITPEEESTFKALTTDEERENFIEQFWARRNSDPREASNEFKAEHYRRITYANEHFASGIPGWKTDRGRTYIMYGEPDGKETHPSGGTYQREYYEGGGTTSVYPFETWRYRHIDGVGEDVELEFVDSSMTGEYRLALDPDEKDALLHVANAGMTDSEAQGLTNKDDRVAGGKNVSDIGRAKDQPFERLAQYFNIQRPPQIKFADLKGVVQTRITYNQLPYTMRTDFIKLSSTNVLVPITIELDNKNLEFKKETQFNRASVNVYGVVTTLQGRIAAEFEHTIAAEYTDEFFDAGKNKRSIYQNIVKLDAGQRYRLDLILKDLNSNYIGSMSYGIMVPKYDGEDLQASTIILANEVKAVPPTYDKLEQFVIGDMKVQPNVKCEYINGQALIAYLQVYNTAYDQATLEPSLQISYIIKSGDKVVQDVEDKNGRSVQFTSGQRVVIVRAFEINNMAPGKYRLDINILDKISNKTMTTGTDLQVVK